MVSEKTIGRLSLYRHLIENHLLDQEKTHIFSHELAALSARDSAQVRRDLMTLGVSGSPARGYDITLLARAIGEYLDAPEPEPIVLVGVGNLGRALLSYFPGRRPDLKIMAAFDKNPDRVGRVVHGCRCYSVDELEKIVFDTRARVGVITVPAEEAQATADALTRAGAQGLLNFARIPLRVPDHVYVENVDFTISLEKVAFFARERAKQ